jgi:AraC-like DNA-binding protein
MMSYYQEQVLAMTRALYAKEDLCRQVVQAKQFIDRHFAQPVDLDTIAGKAFLSKYHFIRVFKYHYGCTPHQYLMEVRIAAAKKLLRTGMPVAEVSYSVGFHSPTSFTGLFKRITGSSPLAFRNKLPR